MSVRHPTKVTTGALGDDHTEIAHAGTSHSGTVSVQPQPGHRPARRSRLVSPAGSTLMPSSDAEAIMRGLEIVDGDGTVRERIDHTAKAATPILHAGRQAFIGVFDD
jgi:hypothetical protein